MINMKMTVGSLFSGIGGFDLGLERAGMEVKWQVENDDFCNRVLVKHWPHVKRYGDIKNVKREDLERVDLICGGFPCQPFSTAGKRKGKEDDRYLWPEMLRIIKEQKPTWIIGENVAGIVNMELESVCASLEAENYEVWPIIIPACAVNAPHRRDRVWILVHAKFNGCYSTKDESSNRKGSIYYTQRPNEICKSERTNSLWDSLADIDSECGQEYQRGNQFQEAGREGTFGWGIYEPDWKKNWIEIATRLCRVDDGIPNRMDRLKSLGNAIVPQIAEIIGRYIIEVER